MRHAADDTHCFLVSLRRTASWAPRRATALAAATALLLGAPMAAAEDLPDQAHHFLTFGPLAGFAGHTDSPILAALGGEVAYTYYPGSAYVGGIGAFVQGQSVGLEHFRGAGGLQANLTIAGIEAGAYYEQGSRGKASAFGIHLAPFVSLGFVSVAFRVGIPLTSLESTPLPMSTADVQKYAIDLGLIATIKVPLALDGSYLNVHF